MSTVAPAAVPTVSAALTRDDIAIATRAAETFIKLYYTAYDSTTRVADLPNFYRPSSSITWNGNALQGQEGVKQLVEKMPPTHHEMMSFDCHPIPGSSPPSLLVNVSGSVLHGRQPIVRIPGPRSIDNLPRMFSQVFMLVPDQMAPGDGTKYYVSVDALRFVG